MNFPVVTHDNPGCGTSRNVLAIIQAAGYETTVIEYLPGGVRLCRPSEAVLDLLDNLPPGPLVKEDGQMIIDAEGNRLV